MPSLSNTPPRNQPPSLGRVATYCPCCRDITPQQLADLPQISPSTRRPKTHINPPASALRLQCLTCEICRARRIAEETFRDPAADPDADVFTLIRRTQPELLDRIEALHREVDLLYAAPPGHPARIDAIAAVIRVTSFMTASGYIRRSAARETTAALLLTVVWLASAVLVFQQGPLSTVAAYALALIPLPLITLAVLIRARRNTSAWTPSMFVASKIADLLPTPGEIARARRHARQSGCRPPTVLSIQLVLKEVDLLSSAPPTVLTPPDGRRVVRLGLGESFEPPSTDPDVTVPS